MKQIEQSAVPAGAGALPTGESPVVERMRGLRSRWPSGSGVAVFNDYNLRPIDFHASYSRAISVWIGHANKSVASDGTYQTER